MKSYCPINLGFRLLLSWILALGHQSVALHYIPLGFIYHVLTKFSNFLHISSVNFENHDLSSFEYLRNLVYYVGNIVYEGTKVRMKTEMEGISGAMQGTRQRKRTMIG